ncbi:MAG TPA: coenzyme F420-0:L-glutamate ligase [Bacteroidales bacterium]|nr:coenzyme F420-0:L-glutamate ligase [Bacteroidales bacterium]
MKQIGVCAKGISCPIIREGDNLAAIVTDSILEAVHNGASGTYDICNKAVVGITESIIARSQGNYATIDDIAHDIRSKFGDNSTIYLLNPIYSRNRFAIILRGIARAAKRIVLVMPQEDEVGNVRNNHPFTAVHYDQYYQKICANEGAIVDVYEEWNEVVNRELPGGLGNANIIICNLHDYAEMKEKMNCKNAYSLADILAEKCEFGLLGSNKADEGLIKLFPNKQKTQVLLDEVQRNLRQKTGKEIIVCAYGDGCFKDPVGGIWEFADPVTMPAYTNPEIIESTPNELKVKALADDKFKNLSGRELSDAIEQEIKNKSTNLKGSMQSQGTTPRLYRDLLASLMDLISGSGDRCTPIVLIQNYFNE